MIRVDRGVARLPEKNARIVSEINHRVAHDFDALIPLAASGLVLAVARRADIGDAEFVAGGHIRARGRDVHPADVIAVALAQQRGGEVVHPVGIRRAEAGPVVGGALRVAGEPDEFVIQINAASSRAALEFGLAEAGVNFANVGDFAVHRQDRINVVKIGIVHVPEMRGGERAGGGERRSLAAREILRRAFDLRADISVGAHDDLGKTCGRVAGRFIAHLRLDVDLGGFAGNVVIFSEHINAGGFQIFVERQCLIDLAHDVQPRIAGKAAEIRIAVAELPFELGAGGFFLVVRAVVHFHREHIVLPAELHQRGEVEATGGDAIFVNADGLAVQKKMRGLPETLELDENFPALGVRGQFEMLPIPADAQIDGLVAARVADERAVAVHVVPCVRQAHVRPLRVVKRNLFRIRHILADEFPAGIEIVGRARRVGRREFCIGSGRRDLQPDHGDDDGDNFHFHLIIKWAGDFDGMQNLRPIQNGRRQGCFP